MRPSARLDLVFVPTGPDRPLERGRRVFDRLQALGVITADGGPGRAAARLVAGGFRRVTLDRPERLTLYANRQGGFAVSCPTTGANVVPAFSTAWESARHRADTPGILWCPACGERHPLEALAFRPAAAFGPWALVVGDAGAPALAEPELVEGLGAVVTVLRRG